MIAASTSLPAWHLSIAAGGKGSQTYITPTIANALFGTKFKIVLGYRGGSRVNIAMERGEVDGRGSNAWGAWKSTRPLWLSEKKINILVQIGLKKAPDLPDVPLLMDLASNPEDRSLLKVLSASTAIGRPIFTTPDVPADRVSALREAFDRMMKDPGFLSDAKKENFDIDPVSGQQLQSIVQEIVSMPKPLAGRLQTIIGEVGDNRGG